MWSNKPTALPITNVLRAGNTIYVSGQVPLDGRQQLCAGGIEEQTDVVLDNLEAALASVGATMRDVVKTTVYLTDVKRDFGGMNKVYARRFGDNRPTRSTIGAALAIEALVEIEAVAVLGEAQVGEVKS